MTHRTTLTLEDDVAERLRDLSRREGRSIKEVVNDTLRAGLSHRDRGPVEPYQVPARAMGLRSGIDLDDIQALVDRLDGPERH
ncbi:MAG: CopG family transcriptional regulator [Actinomycetota bacterium]